MIISKYAEKALDKIQHPFMMKADETGIEQMYLSIIKAIYKKSIPNIILNGEKLKPFPLYSRRRQWYPLFHYYST
jgi:hypothetical protein